MRRPLVLGVVVAGAVTLVAAAPALAGTVGRVGVAPLTIEKEVEGVVPPDTEFTVTVECDDPAIFVPGSPSGVASAEIDFDEEGDPDGSNTLTFVASTTCTVTETEDGDAEEVSYECEGQIPLDGAGSSEFPPATNGITDPCVSNGPQDDPIQVQIVTEGQSATVTVTNEFPDPVPPAPAAQAVTVAPNFTG